jgi:hypothetical protein
MGDKHGRPQSFFQKGQNFPLDVLWIKKHPKLIIFFTKKKITGFTFPLHLFTSWRSTKLLFTTLVCGCGCGCRDTNKFKIISQRSRNFLNCPAESWIMPKSTILMSVVFTPGCWFFWRNFQHQSKNLVNLHPESEDEPSSCRPPFGFQMKIFGLRLIAF